MSDPKPYLWNFHWKARESKKRAVEQNQTEYSLSENLHRAGHYGVGGFSRTIDPNEIKRLLEVALASPWDGRSLEKTHVIVAALESPVQLVGVARSNKEWEAALPVVKALALEVAEKLHDTVPNDPDSTVTVGSEEYAAWLRDVFIQAVVKKDTKEVTRLLDLSEDIEWMYHDDDIVKLRTTWQSLHLYLPEEASVPEIPTDGPAPAKRARYGTSFSSRFTQVGGNLYRCLERRRAEYSVDKFWATPPSAVGNAVTLVFVNIAAQVSRYKQDEFWADEPIPANLDEPFVNVVQRLRVHANQKYRHPFAPATCFSIPLPAGTDKDVFEAVNLFSGRPSLVTVAAAIAVLGGKHTIEYIRNDTVGVTIGDSFPQFLLDINERRLPSWFSQSAPPNWVEPVPPNTYVHDQSSPLGSGLRLTYEKIPLLQFHGNGRNILPNVTSPPIMASHLYLAIHNNTSLRRSKTQADLRGWDDLIREPEKLSPPLALDVAKSLLGRVIAFSQKPLKGQKGKKPKGKSTAPTELAYAFGYDPETKGLHCMDPNGNSMRQMPPFILDLKEPSSEDGERTHRPFELHVKHCQWVGMVSIQSDRQLAAEAEAAKKVERLAKEPLPERPAHAHESTAPADANKRKELILQEIVSKMTSIEKARVFEVAPVDDECKFLAGDVNLAKGDLSFDLVISKVKPGIWTAHSDTEDTSTNVTLAWLRTGDVNYQALPTLDWSADRLGTPRWSKLGSFSIDSGVAGIFASSLFEDESLEKLGYMEGQYESFLEELADMSLDTPEPYLAVPGGIIAHPGDGGFRVTGVKDDEGFVIAVKLMIPRD